jgi:cell division protein ZapA (FtsZ GTPase activity inhibitor)
MRDERFTGVTSVRILGREYRIRNARDPEHARAVAAHVDRVMREIQAQAPDTQDAPILAALNIASDLLLCQEQLGVPRERMQALLDLIDSV